MYVVTDSNRRDVIVGKLSQLYRASVVTSDEFRRDMENNNGVPNEAKRRKMVVASNQLQGALDMVKTLYPEFADQKAIYHAARDLAKGR